MALVAAVIVLALVSAMGLGLVITTSLEPAAAANYEHALQARYAAEAGVAAAAHELSSMADWNAALAGLAVSRTLEATGAEVVLPDGSRRDVARLTGLANCGREAGCSQGDLDAFTADRPWGPNNPRWTPFGVLTLEGAGGGPGGRPRVVAVVWVGDDPADADSAPLRDTPPDAGSGRGPGACVVAIRAEGFAARGAHRTITATVARPAPGCGPGGRLVSWRESP